MPNQRRDEPDPIREAHLQGLRSALPSTVSTAWIKRYLDLHFDSEQCRRLHEDERFRRLIED